MPLLTSLLDAMGESVFVYPLTADGAQPFLAYNRAVLDTYGYTDEELRAMRIEDVVNPGAIDVEDAHDLIRETREATFESEHRRKDGRTFPVQTTARLIEYEGQLCVLAVSRSDEDRRSFQNDVLRANLRLERTVDQRTRDLEAFADDLRILHRITTAEHDSHEARYRAYLDAGCEMFGLPIGILSETPEAHEGDGRVYRLDAVVSPDPGIAPGLTIPLREAFCDRVIETGATVTYADAAADAPDHPACVDRGLRAFIGTPVHVAGELFGTVNFVSPDPRPEGFSESEVELIEVMAAAIGRQLHLDRSEAESRRALAWYRSVVDTTDAAIAVVAPDGTVRASNAAARDVLGLDEADALPASRLTRDGRPFGEQPEVQALREGRPVRNVLQGIPSGGGTLWFNVSASPVDEDFDGDPDVAMVVFQDVTSLHSATARAERYGQLLASVLDASLDGLMAFRTVRDPDGRILDFEWMLVNPRAEQITGYSASELVGRRMLDVFPGNRDSGFFDTYRRVVETQERASFEQHYPHDGLDVTFRVVATPLAKEDGFTVSFTSIQQPVS